MLCSCTTCSWRKQDALEQLRKMKAAQDAGTSDASVDHPKADKLLLWLVDDPEIYAAFMALERWYE